MLQDDIASVTVEEKAAGAFLVQLLSLEEDQLLELREALEVIAAQARLQLPIAQIPHAI